MTDLQQIPPSSFVLPTLDPFSAALAKSLGLTNVRLLVITAVAGQATRVTACFYPETAGMLEVMQEFELAVRPRRFGD